MRPANYSYQTARFVLPVLVLVGGGAALGQFIQPGVGAAVGAGAGGLVLLFLLARATWIARRGDAWVTAGRALGLKSIYSGRIPRCHSVAWMSPRISSAPARADFSGSSATAPNAC
jgi:hypothetical protein